MKPNIALCVVGLLILHSRDCVEAADPLGLQREAVVAAFGKATVQGTRLMKSERASAEPMVWLVFAEDTHRKGELVKLRLQRELGRPGWVVSSAGAGQLLERVPPARLEWEKVKVGPAEARLTAEQGAKLARTTFDQVEYQLANQPAIGVPEWALSLYDAEGFEVGFVIVSAVTGAVIHQDFSGPVPPVPVGNRQSSNDEVENGEAAARAVKRGARKAWDWTEKAGRETKGFFKELFR